MSEGWRKVRHGRPAGLIFTKGWHICREMLEAFGGHPSAAGVTIHESRIDEFRARFSEVVDEWTHEGTRLPTLHVDAEMRLDEVNLQIDPGDRLAAPVRGRQS